MTINKAKKVNNKVTYKDYMSLIETVTKVEYSRMPSCYVIEFAELLNIGIITIHTLLNENPNREYNITYLSTAIKWAIRNELRRRYKWYSRKNKTTDSDKSNVREAIYETILSIDELAEKDNPTQIKDSTITPHEGVELNELNLGVRAAIKKLPQRQKEIIEARFYKNKKLKELAEEFDISPSRISRVIQSALNKIKAELQHKELV